MTASAEPPTPRPMPPATAMAPIAGPAPMGATVEADGAITPLIGPFPPGRSVVLRADMDVILVIANCPHILDPRERWSVTPLRATAWRGPVTPEDDAIRNATPEGLRAFLNV